MTSRDDVYANVSEFTPVDDVVKPEKPGGKKTTKTTKNKDKCEDKKKKKNKKNIYVVNEDVRKQLDNFGGRLSVGVDGFPVTNGDDRSAVATVEKHRHDRPPSLTVITQSQQPDVDDGNDAASSCGIYEELPASPIGTSETMPSLELMLTSITKTTTNNRRIQLDGTGGIGEPATVSTVSANVVSDNEPLNSIVVLRAADEHPCTSTDKPKQRLPHTADEYVSVVRLPVGSEDDVGRPKSIDDVTEDAKLDVRSKTTTSSATSSSVDLNGIDVAAATTPTSGFVDESIYSNCGEDVLGSRFSLALASSTGDEVSLRSRNFADAVTSSVGEGESHHIERVNVVVKQSTTDVTDEERPVPDIPGPAYVAMYHYDADDGDYNEVDVEEILTFDVHDVIYFLGERRGRWMKGQMRNTGEIGWFPSTHVREGISASSIVKSSKYATISGTSAFQTKLASWHHQHETSELVHNIDTDEDFDDEYDEGEDATAAECKYYVALYPYVATHSGDVTFAAGDVIRVITELDTGWWEGTVVVSNQTGFFPGSYVKSVESNDTQTPTSSGTDLSLSVNPPPLLADGREASDNLAQKKRDKKSSRKKTPNVLSNFFSTLPRRFSQSPHPSSTGDHPSPTPTEDQKKNGKKSKKRPPMLPAEWTDCDMVSVADSSKVDLEKTPAVVRNGESGKASKVSPSTAVSVQLNRILSKQAQSPNNGSMPYNRSMSLGPAVGVRPTSQDTNTKRADKGKRPKSMAILPHQLVVESTETSATSPALPTGVFKKNQRQAIESQKLFTGKEKGTSLFQKKPMAAPASVQDSGFADKSNVVDLPNPLRPKSMSTSDLTRLDESIASGPNASWTPSNGLSKCADLQFNERDTKINVNCKSPSRVAAPPVAIKTYKRSKSAVLAQLTASSGAGVDDSVKPAVESTETQLPVVSDRLRPDVLEKINGVRPIEAQFSVRPTSASPCTDEFDSPDGTVDANPSVEKSESLIARSENVDSTNGEPHGVGGKVRSPTATHQSPQVARTKPLLPPKPSIGLVRHKSFNETVRSRQSPTTSNELDNNRVKLQVRPEFMAPFAKPPRRRPVGNDISLSAAAGTVVAAQSVANGNVRETKAKSAEREAPSITNSADIGTDVSRHGNDTSPAPAKNKIRPRAEEQLAMVGRGLPSMKEKPLPLKPKPVLRVVDIEITT